MIDDSAREIKFWRGWLCSVNAGLLEVLHKEVVERAAPLGAIGTSDLVDARLNSFVEFRRICEAEFLDEELFFNRCQFFFVRSGDLRGVGVVVRGTNSFGDSVKEFGVYFYPSTFKLGGVLLYAIIEFAHGRVSQSDF
jgi:hypothetical protein